MSLIAKLALGRLLSALRGAWGLVLRYPWQAALCASLLACAWLWHGKGKAEAQRDAAIAAKVAQAAEFTAAATEAERRAREARAEAETLSKGLADAAENHARDLDAISRRNLAERVQGKGLCPGTTPAAAVPVNTEGAAGTDTGGVYAFTVSETDALRRHEVRSRTCERWALDLIDAGLAVGE